MANTDATYTSTSADCPSEVLLQGLGHLVVRYAICDLQAPMFTFYSTEEPNKALGRYDSFAAGMAEQLQVEGNLDELEQATCAGQLRASLAQGKGLCRYDYMGTAAGSHVFYRLSITPLQYSDDTLVSALILVMDITDAHKSEILCVQELKDSADAATSANESKTRFLSGVSHDIRTPLNTVIGMTAIAQAHADEPGRVKDCLNKINTSSRHLLGIMNDLLDMDSIERGNIVLEETKFNFSNLIENMIVMVRPEIDERLHDFNVEIHNIEHDNVIGDSLRIQQVFTNIISNAAKYTPVGGSVSLDVSEIECSRAGFGCYKFVVTDNGIGMDDAFVKRVLELNSSPKVVAGSSASGSGLGLAISKSIIGLMDGDFNIETKPNQGTSVVFSLCLKLQEADDSVATHAASFLDASGDYQALGNYEGKRFLLVEDNVLNQEMTEELISETGACVEVAENGKVAVDKVQEAPVGYYDLVFMDIQMPVMDGYEATMAIRALPDGKGENLPIVALTANAFAEDVVMAMSAGVNEHVSKPIDFNRLTQVIKAYVG